ncbi:urease accessory protein [Paramagnetospirillum kuznetsovii]|uniref:Urease accessory protein UreD n=2 Tax=Paramagnetospirillum kuznetsovii TaxID=2053833 RepID=A0A364NTR7_9PROT|nr:urease accessory protein [Paramagnetospirillum kuznetsovii]
MWGKAEIVFEPGRLGRLYQQAPLRVLFPDPPDGEPIQAALVTTSGGLAGGDRLELSARAAAGAVGMVVASAAEKIYRSTGPDTKVDIGLTVEKGAWLEVLPQETIVFEGARLRRSTRLDLAADARAMVGEMLVFGRTAKGESLSQGLVHDAWEIRRDGRLIWADALHLDGDIAAKLKAPGGFGGALACATLVLATPRPMILRDGVREMLDGRAGATVVGDLLIVRWLDEDAARLRKSFGTVWAMLRHEAAGLPRRLPRIWEI